jgi:aminotransferase EvaB
MDRVNEIASKNGLKVIEDCAQAHGATWGDSLAGSMSDLSAFSFYPTKILGGYGDGGMICTRSEKIAEKCRKLRFYGMESQYYSVEEGINSRLDEVHAAILRNKLKKLPEYINRRNVIAKLYDKLLADLVPLVLPRQTQKGRHAFYLYVVRHPQRDLIIKALKEKEIFLNISYPWPIHTMTGYAHLGYTVGDLPNTELVQREIFSLPMYPSLEDSEVERVCFALREVMRNL